MPRRFNYTGRKKIERADALIRLRGNGGPLTFDAELRLSEYKLDEITPQPRVHVEAYRGASALWKRFDFGRIGTLTAPPDRSLDEFGVPEGILFRIKITAEGEALGKLLAEADALRPRLPNEEDDASLPLIQHVAADDIGDELWRVNFDGSMPLLKINSRIPMGAAQFLVDSKNRAMFTPAVMRQVLTRILVIDRDTGDEEDEMDWRQRWLRFADGLGIEDCPGCVGDDASVESVERWIDTAVEAFCARAAIFGQFAQQEGQQ